MKGILADVNALGHVEYLVQLMQTGGWAEFWQELGLVLLRFEDIGLARTSSDLEIFREEQQPATDPAPRSIAGASYRLAV